MLMLSVLLPPADPAEHGQRVYASESVGVDREAQGGEAVFGSAQSILPVLRQVRREEHRSLHPLPAGRLIYDIVLHW